MVDGWNDDYQELLKTLGISCLYHVTDKENLASIIIERSLSPWKYLSVNGIKVPRPGGDAVTHRLDSRFEGRDDSVHLYAERPNETMICNMMYSGRFSQLYILEIDLSIIRPQSTIFWIGDPYFKGEAIDNVRDLLEEVEEKSLKLSDITVDIQDRIHINYINGLPDKVKRGKSYVRKTGFYIAKMQSQEEQFLEMPKGEQKTLEEGSAYELKDPFFRLNNIDAVRGEGNKVFTLIDEIDRTEAKVGAHYDYWLSEGICPVNGIVGYIDSRKNIDTPEGKLCYLVCTGNLIVPVLEWGLEKIDDWEYQDKVQNNKILSYDRSGKLCMELRNKKKTSSPTRQKSIFAVPEDRQVIHFAATIQQRIEGGRHFSPNYIRRNIRLTYTKRGSILNLEVIGIMQLRTARFKSDNGRVLTYEDTTRPFTFYEVETEPDHNSIVRVSIFQKNEHFEDIEYRYMIDYNG